LIGGWLFLFRNKYTKPALSIVGDDQFID